MCPVGHPNELGRQAHPRSRLGRSRRARGGSRRLSGAAAEGDPADPCDRERLRTAFERLLAEGIVGGGLDLDLEPRCLLPARAESPSFRGYSRGCRRGGVLPKLPRRASECTDRRHRWRRCREALRLDSRPRPSKHGPTRPHPLRGHPRCQEGGPRRIQGIEWLDLGMERAADLMTNQLGMRA
jgi:hypothetical protein